MCVQGLSVWWYMGVAVVIDPKVWAMVVGGSYMLGLAKNRGNVGIKFYGWPKL